MFKKSAFILIILGMASILPGCTIIDAPPQAMPALDSSVAADNLLVRGKAYFVSGDFTLAVDEFSASIELNKSNADAYYFRGWAYAANGAIDRANADFNSVISLKPELAGAYNGRQWCNANLAQWDKDSLLYLYQKLESEAGLIEVYKGPGWDFVKQMQWELAVVPDPKEAVKSDPAIFDVYCNLGFCCFKKAQWAAIIDDMQATYKKNSDLNKGNWNLEWATGKARSWDKVIQDNSYIIRLITGKTIGPGFVSTSDSAEGWRDASVKCYNEALQGQQGNGAAAISTYALNYIKAWEKALNITR